MGIDKKLIEKIFYGIASLGGLFCVVIGLFGTISLTLQLMFKAPRQPYYNYPAAPTVCNCESEDKCAFTEEERESLREWREEFKDWRIKRKEYETNTIGRFKNESAATLAFLLVGTPIFFYFKSRFNKA